jgi:hypothetical protein
MAKQFLEVNRAEIFKNCHFIARIYVRFLTLNKVKSFSIVKEMYAFIEIQNN